MSDLLLATAGHIDHGKTALITALNGFIGDKTDEEKRRGITIDLSFSNLKNESANISFIDVPGHENLLKTMISGVFGVQGALLIVACNEGLRAQSFEHIKILHLLGIKNIILCLTKCDLVQIPQIQKVKNECLNELKKYENFNILAEFELSVKNKTSIEALKNFLLNLQITKENNDNLLPKYYIDRLFSLKGIGLVVTGTLQGGEISKDEELFDYDANIKFSIRSLQTHGNFVQTAKNGRVAININSQNSKNIKKGDFISKKGYFRGFSQIDCIFYGKLTHNQNAIFCIGTKNINAKVIILSSKNLDLPNESHFITLKLEKAVFASFDEHYILLDEKGLAGGGVVLNPVSEPLKKKDKLQLLNALLNKNFLQAFSLLKNIHEKGFGLLCAPQRFNLSQQTALNLAKQLNNAIVDENTLNVYDKSALNIIKEFISFIISKNEFAMFSCASISLKLSWASKMLVQQAIDDLSKILSYENGLYSKKGADFSKLKEKLEDAIFKEIQKGELAPLAPYNIYDIFEIDRKIGDNAMKKLCAKGLVVRLAHNLFISSNNLLKAKTALKELIKKDGYADITNAKKALGLSRKYIISYLEILDKEDDIITINQKRVFK